MKLTLHNYWRSSASQRVRIGLGLKGLEFEYVPVSIIAGEQFAEQYTARNSMAQVPTLEIAEDDGTRTQIAQSLPILEYLDERFPTPPILPKDPYFRARARQLAEIVNAGIQPYQNLKPTRHLKELGIDEQAFARGLIASGIAAFARAAAETAGDFCVGDHPTIADCALVPQLNAARRFGVPLDEHQQLLAIEARCLSLPAFAAAQPDRQPDAPKS